MTASPTQETAHSEETNPSQLQSSDYYFESYAHFGLLHHHDLLYLYVLVFFH